MFQADDERRLEAGEGLDEGRGHERVRVVITSLPPIWSEFRRSFGLLATTTTTTLVFCLQHLPYQSPVHRNMRHLFSFQTELFSPCEFAR